VLAQLIVQLEEPRAFRRAGAAREAQRVRNARAAISTSLYQERLKTLNAADFGDLLLEDTPLFPSSRTCSASSISASSSSGRRIS